MVGSNAELIVAMYSSITQHFTVMKVCRLFPRRTKPWKPLDIRLLFKSCFKRRDSVHCFGKWSDGTISIQQPEASSHKRLTLLHSAYWLSVNKQSHFCCLSPPPMYMSQRFFPSLWTVAKSKAKEQTVKATLNATLRVSLSPIPPCLDLIISQKWTQSVWLRVSTTFILGHCSLQ